MNILAVDDNHAFLAALRALLRGRHQVASVETLEAARLQLAREPYDVALIDLTLPDSSKEDTFAELATMVKVYPWTRFIAVTGSTDIDSTEAVQVVHKVPPEGFASALLSALGLK